MRTGNMAPGSSGVWPPGPGTDATVLAGMVRARLAAHVVDDVVDVQVEAADPWQVTVTIDPPVPDAVGPIQAALAPVRVDVVWYEGSFEVVADHADEQAGEPITIGRCAVCGDVGDRWRHTVPQVPGAPFAFVRTWLLCAVCHGLAEHGDQSGLVGRMRIAELTADQSRALAELLAD